MPLSGWLNNIVAGLGSPDPSRVIHICNRAMCGSPLESKHFFSVHFKILYVLLLVHYSDGGMMMRMLVLCLGFCRKSRIYLKQNCHLSLTLFSLVAHVLQR